MDSETENPMQEKNDLVRYPAFKLGIGLVIIGALLVGLNIILIMTAGKYYPKIMGAGVLSLFWALGMIILPGPEEINMPSGTSAKYKEIFYEANVITRIVWAIYMFAGICVGVCTFFISSVEIVAAVIAVTLIVSFVISAIRFLVLLIKECRRIPEPTDFEQRKFNYYHPSKAGAIGGIILSLILAAASAVGYVSFTLPDYFDGMKDDGVVSKIVGKELPVNFVQGDDGHITIIIDAEEVLTGKRTYDENYNDFLLPVNELLTAFVHSSENSISALMLYQGPDKDMIELSVPGVNVNPAFRNVNIEWTAELNAKYTQKVLRDFNDIFIQTDVYATGDYINRIVIINYPEYGEELFNVYTAEGFCKYMVSRGYEEFADCTLYELEHIILNGDLSSTRFDICESDEFFEMLYNAMQGGDSFGILYNFGCEDQVILSILHTQKFLTDWY